MKFLISRCHVTSSFGVEVVMGWLVLGCWLAEKWVKNVIEVRKLSERIMLIRVAIGTNILSVISGYAAQMGRPTVEKEEFLLSLSKIVDELGQEEFVVIGEIGRA